jgi:hypothetical protein
MADLRHLYAQENRSDAVIDYGEVLFSMNKGDYVKPLVYSTHDDFSWHMVPSVPENLFAELMSSVKFESVGKGRLGTVLVRVDEARGVPIVRTTAKYTTPARRFQPLHSQLAAQIKRLTSLQFDFNNALIESYSNAYTTMGFHSDLALDLQGGSSIAVFSCYKYPEKPAATASRKLVIESKEPNGGVFEVPLVHNSVVVFSVDTNKRFKHKIVLEPSAHPDRDQQWLGITFRQSKTFVQYRGDGDSDDGAACFEDETPMTLASDEQQQAFFKLRRRENEEAEFIYLFHQPQRPNAAHLA